MATAYDPQTYYGYKINNNLTDVVDKELALERIGLNIGDLDIIRGAASEDGAVREDLIAISGLDTPIYKIVDRYQGDTSLYKGILDESAGVNSTLRGNLTINGAVAGSAVRFRYIDDSVDVVVASAAGFRLNEKVIVGIGAEGVVKTINSNTITVSGIIGRAFVAGDTLVGTYSGAQVLISSVTSNAASKFADISTSRVSAWSGGSPSEADPVFYGGQIKISTSGSPLFNGGKISVNKITWGQRAEPRLKQNGSTLPITGEVPTHVITTTINNQTVKLYAMKSIPLKVRGYFRRFDGTIIFNSAAGAKVSWRVVNVNDSNDIQLYTEIGDSNRSDLQYRAINAAERDIEVYYHPDFLTQLYLPSINISELPAASLPALTTLYVPYNELKDFPNFKAFCPNVQDLQIFRNNFYLGANETLRKFTAEVANRIPTSVTSFNMMGTFYGSIRVTNGSGGVVYPYGGAATPGSASAYSVIESACPNLLTLNVSRGDGPYFNPDDYDPTSFLPTVPASCTSYYASYNDFRGVPARGLKERTNLVNFHVDGNSYLTDPTFSLASTNLVNVYIGSSGLPMPDLKGRTSLEYFESQYSRNAGPFYQSNDPNVSEGTYKFANCTNLRALYTYAGGQTGFLPKFKGNPNLGHCDLYAAQSITGGRPNNGDHKYADGNTLVMYNDHFEDAKNINFFRVLSYSLLVGKGFESDTFKNLSSLYYLFWYSYNRTGAGTDDVKLPNVSSCRNLQYFIMPYNNFTGPLPSMSTNPSIYYIDLADNRLDGPVPSFSNRQSLSYLFLHNNRFTTFLGFEGCRSIDYLYLYNNQLAGNIPILGSPSASPNISRVYLFNNLFTGYTKTSFTGLSRLYYLDISNNQLTESDLNNIIDDLFDNYAAAPRGGVNINLRSQTRAVGYNPSSVGSDREKAVRDKITFLQSKGWIITIG